MQFPGFEIPPLHIPMCSQHFLFAARTVSVNSLSKYVCSPQQPNPQWAVASYVQPVSLYEGKYNEGWTGNSKDTNTVCFWYFQLWGLLGRTKIFGGKWTTNHGFEVFTQNLTDKLKHKSTRTSAFICMQCFWREAERSYLDARLRWMEERKNNFCKREEGRLHCSLMPIFCPDSTVPCSMCGLPLNGSLFTSARIQVD